MIKKDENGFKKYLAEKQKIEERLSSVNRELSYPPFDSTSISILNRKTGEALLEFNGFKSRHAKSKTVPERYLIEFYHLESAYKTASKESNTAQAKHDQLRTEETELKRTLFEMSYQFPKGELDAILQDYQSVERKKSELLKSIEEHEGKREAIQQNLSNAKAKINQLKKKRQDILADMAIGDRETSTSLDTIDSELNEATMGQEAVQQLLDNANDIIAGIQALFTKAEKKAEEERIVAREAVGLYLINRADIVGKKYAHTAAQLGQCFTEIQALATVFKDIFGENSPVKITLFADRRLYVPAFSIERGSETPSLDALLDISKVDIPSMVQTEKKNLEEMGFAW